MPGVADTVIPGEKVIGRQVLGAVVTHRERLKLGWQIDVLFFAVLAGGEEVRYEATVSVCDLLLHALLGVARVEDLAGFIDSRMENGFRRASFEDAVLLSVRAGVRLAAIEAIDIGEPSA